MTIFDLDDITVESEALVVADELVKEAITAVNSRRKRRQKIRSCQAKIKMLTSWCRVNKWTQPLLKVKKSFHALEEAIGEDDVNMFGI
tara:strand:- start:108 stop:371 length:264 start_codon:yes stop_codon:yes gene_type:complete